MTGVPVLKRSEGHDETFVKLGVTWFALIGAEVKRERTGDHIAFRVTRATIQAIAAKLKSKGFDFDNHVFELDSSDLEEELNGLVASGTAAD